MIAFIKYRLRYLICFLLVTNFTVILSQTNIQLSNSIAPQWVNKKPINYDSYIGIGMADKSQGNNYQSEAKKNALFDLTSDIKIDISTNSVLHTAQNNNKFNESYNSIIKLSNHDNIEGYRLVDTYENEKYYWVYYELDKHHYENLKIKNKKIAIDKAVNFINYSFIDEKNGFFTSSLRKRIKAFSILLPYLNEDIQLATNVNIHQVSELSKIIQQQLQTISTATMANNFEIIPYQKNHKPIIINVLINKTRGLIDFPFKVKSNDEQVRVAEHVLSNHQGNISLPIKQATTSNKQITFSLFPDINALMSTDSISHATITILKQFVEIPQLIINATIRPLSIFISSSEKNLTCFTSSKVIAPIVESKFRGSEFKLTETVAQSDFVIEIYSDTYKDVSSDILNKNYGVVLTGLNLTIALRNSLTKELIYKTEITNVYGYANTLEIAGLNAYTSERLHTKLTEALFFLKRNIIVM